jgi:hypothetical protein
MLLRESSAPEGAEKEEEQHDSGSLAGIPAAKKTGKMLLLGQKSCTVCA